MPCRSVMREEPSRERTGTLPESRDHTLLSGHGKKPSCPSDLLLAVTPGLSWPTIHSSSV